MAKTHRRRAAHVARQAAAACARTAARTNRAAAAALFTNHDWKQLTDALDGLLRIEISSPFTDLQELCPAHAWLIIDLSYVRVDAHAAFSLRQGITRVVAALETLCVHAETLRPYDSLYTAFWLRVLTSDMNQDVLKEDSTRIRSIIRYMKAKGTHLALRWQGRQLQPVQVITPLHRLLSTVVGTSTAFSYVPVQLALRIEECHLITGDLESIHELLKIPSYSSAPIDGPMWLCEPTVLKELSLRSSALYAHNLEALTALLEDSKTRRIDGLCLDDTTPHDAILPTTYPAIFQRILSMALRPKASQSHDIRDKGVRLSFDKSRHLDVQLINAIENALLQATRPVRALSLACLQPPNFGALMRLTRLMLTPLPTATEDFELDLSCVNPAQEQDEVRDALCVCLAQMVSEAIPRISSTRLVANERVTCRLLYPEIFEDQLLTTPVNTSVSTLAVYDVLSVTPNGLFQIDLTEPDDRGRAITGWIRSTAIANIRIGDRLVVGSNCTKLIVDGEKHGMAAGCSDKFISGILASVGACLKHLSLRSYDRCFSDLVPLSLMWCPHLLELNARNGGAYYGYYGPIWPETPVDMGADLQILDVSNCGLTAVSLRSLTPLPRLRCLHLAENQLDGEGLMELLERLRLSRNLRFVDVSVTAIRDPETEARYTVAKTQLQSYQRNGLVTLEACSAFLSVVSHVEATGELSASVPVDALVSIFQFAGTRPSCVVAW